MACAASSRPMMKLRGDRALAQDAQAGVLALRAAVARRAEPDQCGQRPRASAPAAAGRARRRPGRRARRGSRAPRPAPFAAAGAADHVADHEAAGDGAGAGRRAAPSGVLRSAAPASRKPDHEADHGGEQGHPAAGRAVRAGGAGEHADRDADARARDPVPSRKLTAKTYTSGMVEPPHRRRAHTRTRDLERYAGLFAERTGVMRSSAMRDLMAITARPEVISLAGGLPDTSTFPAATFAAQMTGSPRSRPPRRCSTGRPRASPRRSTASSR